MHFRGWSYAISVVVILSFCARGFSGTTRDDRDGQLYLDLAASSAFSSVGMLYGATSSYDFLASGTLIAPDWVLTAGHVVKGTRSVQFTLDGTTYSASKWVAHPKYSGDLWAGYDIGLIKLSAPVAGVAPAVRYNGAAELGSITTTVGYGMTGTGLTGATTLDYQKRAGQNVADTYSSRRSSRIILTDFDNPASPSDSTYGSSVPLDLEYCVAPGDSGGGLFADFGAGQRLIGVTSFLAAWDGELDSDYGDISGYTRVSSFNSWIDSVINGGGGGKGNKGKPSSVPGLTDYECESLDIEGASVPEPFSVGLLGFGGLALLRRMRR